MFHATNPGRGAPARARALIGVRSPAGPGHVLIGVRFPDASPIAAALACAVAAGQAIASVRHRAAGQGLHDQLARAGAVMLDLVNRLGQLPGPGLAPDPAYPGVMFYQPHTAIGDAIGDCARGLDAIGRAVHDLARERGRRAAGLAGEGGAR